MTIVSPWMGASAARGAASSPAISAFANVGQDGAVAVGLERQAREALGVNVVWAGTFAGEHVAGVERHEADVAFVGVAGGRASMCAASQNVRGRRGRAFSTTPS